MLLTNEELLNIREASQWATSFLKRNVSEANISYLIQYGRIRKIGENGVTLIIKKDLLHYYKNSFPKRKLNWNKKLGDNLNWNLSFEQCKESETTKHVHRIHPYKGKFIPQLVEYFLDEHIDEFKTNSYFRRGDVILDPFCGSGTTLVQANELNLHSIGVDVSAFNALISNVKIREHNFEAIGEELNLLTKKLENFLKDSPNLEFESKLLEQLQKFNLKNFPSPNFKYQVRQKLINDSVYGLEKEKEFLNIYNNLVTQYKINLEQIQTNSFIDKWYIQTVRQEIEFIFSHLKKINNLDAKKVITIILSRTIRSCRATTHADLATLKNPQLTTYYCKKHGKICKPLFSILGWWRRYSLDTLKRLKHFQDLKTQTHQFCLTGDSRNIDIFSELDNRHPDLYKLVKKQKIKGIFSSPPYVGLIDYHEQHAYAYDLFNFERKDNLEIGPLFRGQGLAARKSYIKGISDVLINCKKYLADDFSIFLVANDKWNMYAEIAEKSNLKIIEEFKRPVLNRTEKDKNAFSEIVFHFKNK